MQLIATVEARKAGPWFAALMDADYRLVLDECEKLRKLGYKVRVTKKRLISNS